MLCPPWTPGIEVVISSACEISAHLIHSHLKTHNASLHDFCIHALPLLLDYEICQGNSNRRPGQPEMSWLIDL